MTEMPEELKRRIPHDPKLWVRNFLDHPNEPSKRYDFYTDGGEEDGEFLWYLVDEQGPMNPQQWGDINVLLFCRGGLKTFTCASIAAWAVDTFPSIEGLASAPVDDQRYEIMDRFKDKVEQSGLDGIREKNKLSHQKFKHTVTRDDGSQTISYASLKSRSAWSEGDKIRGLHTHFGVLDESQDVDEGTFATMLEAIDREIPQVDYFPTTFIIGTPKMANTFFHKLWRMSDQKTWSADERRWIQQSESDQFLSPAAREEAEELEEKIEQLRATDGDEELIDEYEQRLDDIEGFTVRGWHIDQFNCPLHSEQDIAYKRQTYSKRKFENEVKANFYSPENDLITNEDVWNILDDDLSFTPTRRWEDSTVFLSVDWGGGKGEGAAKTVLCVTEQRPDDETLYVNRIKVLPSSLSHAEERDEIDTMMRDYDVDLGVVDEGFGDTDREELQDEYGYNERSEQPIYGCYYGNVKDKEEIKWNRNEDSKRFFTCSKTYAVKKMAEDVKNEHIVIPKQNLNFQGKNELGTMILDQLTAPYTERKETQSGKKKVVVTSDRSDDVFDALTYAWIASRMVHGSRRTLHTAAATMQPGY